MKYKIMVSTGIIFQPSNMSSGFGYEESQLPRKPYIEDGNDGSRLNITI